MSFSQTPATTNAQPTDTGQPCVLFFGKDIFFAPVVRSAANSAGWQFIMLASVDASLSSDQADQVRACIVDLTPLDAEKIAAWGQRLSERFPEALRIAFGPHVNVDLFAAAASSGFHPVLAKGQLAAALPKLLNS